MPSPLEQRESFNQANRNRTTPFYFGNQVEATPDEEIERRRNRDLKEAVIQNGVPLETIEVEKSPSIKLSPAFNKQLEDVDQALYKYSRAKAFENASNQGQSPGSIEQDKKVMLRLKGKM
ncbi:hypothetical protein BDZ45DRAFT_735440 [Acephala macrosclerotiorum]|nr:hypothetical protein BDZ45DRAFT_735440 [Acephala macrosclerotiorum]